MGIRNSGMAGADLCRAYLITPHGDSEPGDVIAAFHDSKLITPHGDSEPNRRHPSFAARPTHNPSWGFGTITVQTPDWTALVLITHHGDSEPHDDDLSNAGVRSHNPSWGFGTLRRCRWSYPPEPHNPSWGFGTVVGAGSGGQALQLITPHGDSELLMGGVLSSIWASHNPSWGFGTLRAFSIRPAAVTS